MRLPQVSTCLQQVTDRVIWVAPPVPRPAQPGAPAELQLATPGLAAMPELAAGMELAAKAAALVRTLAALTVAPARWSTHDTPPDNPLAKSSPLQALWGAHLKRHRPGLFPGSPARLAIN